MPQVPVDFDVVFLHKAPAEKNNAEPHKAHQNDPGPETGAGHVLLQRRGETIGQFKKIKA